MKKSNQGISICFLGPDGSGKSTIIDKILKSDLPFSRKHYFHLKPINNKKNPGTGKVVNDPHRLPPYSRIKSMLKLFYFLFLYNLGWKKNVLPLLSENRLVIFDRYYDDILVDNKRYRYGGNIAIAKFVKNLIPRPNLYFILTADAEIIYERKQEVSFKELERQIQGYNALADNNRYFQIDISCSPKEITKEVISTIMNKMNERY